MMNPTRRESLQTLAASGLTLAVGTWLATPAAHGADLTPLDPADGTAKALGYVADASKLAAGAEATYKAGSKCANCLQYRGAEGAASGGCTIFPNKAVQSAGWCRAWIARPK